MSTVAVSEPRGECRVVLSHVSWATFKALVSETDRAGTRYTYDRGRLEIMSPSTLHERVRKMLARFVEMMAFELRMPTLSAGSSTLLSELAERGIEPGRA
jgi:Uma2 family endonuclease